ncbi:MAG TPA: hypothetical protein PKD58_03185, partial [Candidatus Sumerlaeota bacterium]|nr:hypothetical protein [Candidatus Sumerlaeota bacterium]
MGKHCFDCFPFGKDKEHRLQPLALLRCGDKIAIGAKPNFMSFHLAAAANGCEHELWPDGLEESPERFIVGTL